MPPPCCLISILISTLAGNGSDDAQGRWVEQLPEGALGKMIVDRSSQREGRALCGGMDWLMDL